MDTLNTLTSQVRDQLSESHKQFLAEELTTGSVENSLIKALWQEVSNLNSGIESDFGLLALAQERNLSDRYQQKKARMIDKVPFIEEKARTMQDLAQRLLRLVDPEKTNDDESLESLQKAMKKLEINLGELKKLQPSNEKV